MIMLIKSSILDVDASSLLDMRALYSPVKLPFYTALLTHERIFCWLSRFIFGHLYTNWFCDKNFGPEPRQIFGERCQKSQMRRFLLFWDFSEKNEEREKKVEKILIN